MALSPVYPENKTQFPNAIVNSVSFMSTTNIARSLAGAFNNGRGEQSRRSNIFFSLGFQFRYAALLAATAERRKASRSLLIVSAFVAGMPCGKPL